jgi:hypothetical protein
MSDEQRWTMTYHRSSILLADENSTTHMKVASIVAWGTFLEGFRVYLNAGRPLEMTFKCHQAEAHELCRKMDNFL